MKEIPGVHIRTRLQPGDIGAITYLHGYLYAKEYGFDCSFEPYVARPLSEFALAKNDRERIWIVENNEQVSGSIAIVEHSGIEAKLRWLILHPDIRGRGLVRKLLKGAISFCREYEYSKIFLWTAGFLTTAIKLYESEGFLLTEEKAHMVWGVSLTEQRYELVL
jgi:N-acetylglutamate synthase-like GNAT family acetyltransferase